MYIWVEIQRIYIYHLNIMEAKIWCYKCYQPLSFLLQPVQRFFKFFLRVLLCMAFLLHPWDLEMFT